MLEENSYVMLVVSYVMLCNVKKLIGPCYNQIFIVKPYSIAVKLHFSNMIRSDCGKSCLGLPTQPPSQYTSKE